MYIKLAFLKEIETLTKCLFFSRFQRTIIVIKILLIFVLWDNNVGVYESRKYFIGPPFSNIAKTTFGGKFNAFRGNFFKSGFYLYLDILVQKETLVLLKLSILQEKCNYWSVNENHTNLSNEPLGYQ